MTMITEPYVHHEILELRARGGADELRTRSYGLPTGFDQRFNTYRILRRIVDGELFVYGLSGQEAPSGMVLRPASSYCCVARRDFNAGFVDAWAATVAAAPLPDGFVEDSLLPELIRRAAHTRDD